MKNMTARAVSAFDPKRILAQAAHGTLRSSAPLWFSPWPRRRVRHCCFWWMGLDHCIHVRRFGCGSAGLEAAS